ncbi:hypothetical protein BDA99DRAFT_496153 [Phascolomyces articulosus]|uniref:Uncharacterized protein n=1 Tax=Phascolomyces articulosus TaxID=60185 RepID=A0AAD5K9S1_9FUNG|nr:hypothetical protein BDA99DRAFT_496153 [Phascolomyces articulosus]
MRPKICLGSFLLLSIVLLLCVELVQGNTEKLMFSASWDDQVECINDRQDGHVLNPPYSTTQRVIIPHSPNTTITPSLSQHWYILDELRTDMNYELRISYPATSPTDFKLTLYQVCHKDNGNDNKNERRIVLVEADYAGVSNIPGMESAPVKYDIVLENLYLGFLFYQVYKIAAAVAVVLLLGQFIILPKVQRIITQASMDSKNNNDHLKHKEE